MYFYDVETNLEPLEENLGISILLCFNYLWESNATL